MTLKGERENCLRETMKYFNVILVMAIIVMIVIVNVQAIEISNCYTFTSDNEIAYLNTSFDTMTAECFNSGTYNNVTLDCQGNYVNYTGSSETKFFKISSANTLVSKIKNCHGVGWTHFDFIIANTANLFNITVENSISKTTGTDTDFFETVAYSNNVNLYIFNTSHNGTSGGGTDYFLQTDEADNLNIFMINSSVNEIDTFIRKYSGGSLNLNVFNGYFLNLTTFDNISMNTLDNVDFNISDTFGNNISGVTDINGNNTTVLNQYNCSWASTSGTFNCAGNENYYTPYIFTGNKAGYLENITNFDMTNNFDLGILMGNLSDGYIPPNYYNVTFNILDNETSNNINNITIVCNNSFTDNNLNSPFIITFLEDCYNCSYENISYNINYSQFCANRNITETVFLSLILFNETENETIENITFDFFNATYGNLSCCMIDDNWNYFSKSFCIDNNKLYQEYSETKCQFNVCQNYTKYRYINCYYGCITDINKFSAECQEPNWMIYLILIIFIIGIFALAGYLWKR